MSRTGRRVLIIGASGQVGRELVAELARRPGPLDVVAASRSNPDPARQVELERPETVERLVLATRPDHVILAAAATSVAWCEAHPDRSRTINVLGTEATARAAYRAGATLAFISTDYVFDGVHGPYSEREPTNPINVYGTHKLEAEGAVLGVDTGNLVVRSCQVFGDDPRRVNYVMRTVDGLRRGEALEAAGDLFGTPTFAPDLARILVDLVLDRAAGIWHVAGDTFLSRYELAKRAAVAFGCTGGTIAEVETHRMNDAVDRPRRAGLLSGRLTASGLNRTTPLDEALAALAMQAIDR